MTTNQEIMSFEKKLEDRNFILDDRLLEQLLNGKLNRLRKQYENSKELRRLIKRHK
jgi:hypothetical protein